MVRRGVVFGALGLSALVAGCDEKPADPKPAAEAPPPTAAPAPAAPRPPPDPLAGLTVDELGLFLQTQRVDMAAKGAEDRVRAIVGALPVRDKAVPVVALRNAKTQHVGALVRALGQAGAVQIDVKTPARTGAETVLKLVPQDLAGTSTPDCAVVAMVKKDSTSAVWRVKGGTAAKFGKGLAGPDLSMTLGGIKDQASSCPSQQWFLTGEENVIWGLVFDLGLMVKNADPPLRPTAAVLLYEAPVAGRAVSLGRGKGAAKP